MKLSSLAAVAVTATLAASIVLPAFAMDSTSPSAGTAMSAGAMMHTDKKTIDVACVQKAVATREAAIGADWSTFSSAVGAAYSARAVALNTAWGMTDAKTRNAAIKAAWAAFSKSRKDARSAWNTSQKTAWSNFKTAAKSCKGGATSVSADAGVAAEAGGANVDAQ